MNSLLDVENLARSVGSMESLLWTNWNTEPLQTSDGAACTCVVTEYRYHAAQNFSIGVQPFTAEELKAQFTEMVSSYRHNYFDSPDMETAEERRYWEDRSKVALDTLRAMFRGRITEEVLRSQGQSEQQIVATLLDWARELGPGTDAATHVADSPEACAEMLARLTSERVTSGGAAEWPYIQKITVSLDVHILSKGLVLVDLPGMSSPLKIRSGFLTVTPGLRDLNSARRNITERYLVQCDEIFAVCRIDRATTDEGVNAVFERAKQARLSNVGIICTRSDVSSPCQISCV